jgi:hypothetical protein
MVFLSSRIKWRPKKKNVLEELQVLDDLDELL